MSCNKCNTPSGKCGCKDTAYTTLISQACPPDPDCPTPQVCSEFVNTQCVFAPFGIKDLFIDKQDSLMEILQKLDINLRGDANCLDPSQSCNATTLVYPTTITETTIALAWQPVTTNVTGYTVYYKVDSAIAYFFLPSQTTTSAIISGLTANTNYNIYIRATNAPQSCFCDSSIITVKTLVA